MLNGTYEISQQDKSYAIYMNDPIGAIHTIHISFVENATHINNSSINSNSCMLYIMLSPNDISTYTRITGMNITQHMLNNVIFAHLPCIKLHLKSQLQIISYVLDKSEISSADDIDNMHTINELKITNMHIVDRMKSMNNRHITNDIIANTDRLLLKCLIKYYHITGADNNDDNVRIKHAYLTTINDVTEVFGSEYISVVYRRHLLGVSTRDVYYCMCLNHKLYVVSFI